MRPSPLIAGSTLAGTAVLLAACGSSSASASGGGSGGASSGAPGASSSAGGSSTITVLAASSLTDVFAAIQKDFQKAHPGVTVRISYEASSLIVSQVNQGAPADLVAFADTDSLAMLTRSKLVGKDVIIAKNSLEIATPPSNPGKVSGLADLAKKSVKVVLCAAQVPCGKGAAKVLTAAHVKANVVSFEQNVRATLIKVEQADAQAAIVYHSDVASAGRKVLGVVIPPGQNEIQSYPVQAVSKSAAAAQFVAFTAGAQGQKEMRAFGFLAP